MDRLYWRKQTPDKPLFPELLWSRPENRLYAGKLLIIGGNLHGFAAPAEAFAHAEKAGIGVARVVLPDALQKTVGKVFAAGEFAPSTPSGSFAQKALAELLSLAAWADGVLLAGDFGRNSETAILLEKFAEKYTGQLALTGDAADYFIAAPTKILAREGTTFVIDFAQLQKLAINAHFTEAFTSSMDLLRFVDTLHDFSHTHAASIITNHLENTFVAVKGQISSTRTDQPAALLQQAAQAATWHLQNPTKPLESLTTAML